jgi:hypothetical protein
MNCYHNELSENHVRAQGQAHILCANKTVFFIAIVILSSSALSEQEVDLSFKVKFVPEQTMKAQEGQRYNSTISLTSALDWDGWLTPHPDKETRYPLYRRVGGPQGRYGYG